MIPLARLWRSGVLLLTVWLLGAAPWPPLSAALSTLARLPRGGATLGFVSLHGWGRYREIPAARYCTSRPPAESSQRQPPTTVHKAILKRSLLAAANGRDMPAAGTNAARPNTAKPSSVLGRLWRTVKRLFGAGECRHDIPLDAGMARFALPAGSRVLPSAGLRQFQTLNFLMPLPAADGAQNSAADASPYAHLVHAQPSALMSRFVEQAPLRVREAVKSTVGALVGSFYRYCVETTMITTSDRLVALIHSMQMTGYMLWNAECRYCLSQQLQSEPAAADPPPSPAAVEPPAGGRVAAPQLKAEIVPPYNTDSLLWYIKRLPDETANALLDSMTTGVLDAMQESSDLVVESLTGMALGQSAPPPSPQQPAPSGTTPRIILQQTGSSCVQLCFWQLALGYCLRDQEAKLELHHALKSS
ncbi:signal peptide-containing protein [Babesia caballi]|uniref:Signal peptide-containing protein n=1 Tax=Babesia caballi TaxID=5871 RepID=A0AAV4M191_BABCB|nr:signal peptide-containing protein [Babesia caballi]